MPATLNNVATQNAYATGTTLECPRGKRVSLDVFNATIFYQIGLNVDVHKMDPNEIRSLLGGEPQQFKGNIIYGPEIFCAPKSQFLNRLCDSIRVRSAVAGKPAQVTVTVWKEGELA